MTTSRSGWYLDSYPNADDTLSVWLLTDAGERLHLRYRLATIFYVAGPCEQLRSLWKYLRRHAEQPLLSRQRRHDIFSGWRDVLAAELARPLAVAPMLRELRRRFPYLTYYDADIPFALRFSAETKVFPLTRCQVELHADGTIANISSLECRWSLETNPPPLTTLTLFPSVEPQHAEPTKLTARFDGKETYFDLRQPKHLTIIRLNALFKRYDPDVVLTAFGDEWLFPYLLDDDTLDVQLNPNRDPARQPQRRKANTISSYGQIMHRPQQTYLFGRWHIDGRSSVLWDSYGFEGAMAQARVTGISVQETARRSPGAGIGALQMLTALKRGVLVPVIKEHTEFEKSALDLIRGDKGGIVYQPLVGLHENVVEVDFTSMYPSIMVNYNLSAETMGVQDDSSSIVPELGMSVTQAKVGLIAEMLKPLLNKRIGIKESLITMDSRDCRYARLKAISDGLKWLLVVAFGYAGYKRSRFGRIESHQAIIAWSRELLLRAKEVGEEMGLSLVHMYVDGLYFKRANGSKVNSAEIKTLLNGIEQRTGLPITLEGTYRWIAFLPSKRNPQVPVPNSFFGAFDNGELKIRGIELRRGDCPPLIKRLQQTMIERLANATADTLLSIIMRLCDMLRLTISRLRQRQIKPQELLITQRLSKELAAYSAPSAAARAAMQLQQSGKVVHAGMHIRFVFTRGKPGVYAWDSPNRFRQNALDVERYQTLLLRAAQTVLQPFGVDASWLQARLCGKALQLSLPFSMARR